MTARAIMEVLDASTAADRATLAKELTRAALMGARGNSGVIFSQILRGAAEALGEAGLLDAATIRRAFRAASDAAYRAVRRPVEGTMLSVIRELAEEAEDPRNAESGAGGAAEEADRARRGRAGAHAGPARRPARGGSRRRGRSRPARDRPRRLRGAVRRAAPGCAGRGRPRGRPRRRPPGAVGVPLLHGLPDRGREPGRARRSKPSSSLLGDSLLVVGDSNALKIHVHTDEPGKALALRDGARHDRGRRDREHAQADRGPLRADHLGAAARAHARDRRRRGRAGRGQPPPLRELRRDARDRGRPDDESLDRRHPRRDRGDARDRGARAARTTRT